MGQNSQAGHGDQFVQFLSSFSTSRKIQVQPCESTEELLNSLEVESIIKTSISVQCNNRHTVVHDSSTHYCFLMVS